ncbi:ORF409 [White spot syndrome virus]|uniref:ORF409 n=1 Tax=White spot syndrome virus TaxID=342409 RepID=A0A2D3I5Y5_9VIRU|nr:ORF409 [White spot syndrome virus]
MLPPSTDLRLIIKLQLLASSTEGNTQRQLLLYQMQTRLIIMPPFPQAKEFLPASQPLKMFPPPACNCLHHHHHHQMEMIIRYQ